MSDAVSSPAPTPVPPDSLPRVYSPAKAHAVLLTALSTAIGGSIGIQPLLSMIADYGRFTGTFGQSVTPSRTATRSLLTVGLLRLKSTRW